MIIFLQRNIRYGLMKMDLAVDRNFSCLFYFWSFNSLSPHLIHSDVISNSSASLSPTYCMHKYLLSTGDTYSDSECIKWVHNGGSIHPHIVPPNLQGRIWWNIVWESTLKLVREIYSVLVLSVATTAMHEIQTQLCKISKKWFTVQF